MQHDLDLIRQQYYSDEMVEYDIYSALKIICSVPGPSVSLKSIGPNTRKKFASYIDSFLKSRKKTELVITYENNNVYIGQQAIDYFGVGNVYFGRTVQFNIYRFGGYFQN